MSKQRVIIFTFSKKDAQFAVKFVKEHPRKAVTVLAASIPARLILQRNSIDPFQDTKLFYASRVNHYHTYIKNFYHASTAIYKHIERYFEYPRVAGIALIRVLRILLESEFLTVAYAYWVFQTLEKKYPHATWYYSNDLTNRITGWEPDHFSAAAIIRDYFCDPKRSVHFNNSQASYSPPFSFPITLFFSPKKIVLLMIVVITRYVNRFLFRFSHLRQNDVFIFSAGYNLYYYKDLYMLMRQDSDSMSIFTATGSQSIDHEYMLRRSKINFTPLDFFRIPKNATNEYKKTEQAIKTVFHNDTKVMKILPRLLPAGYKRAIIHKILVVLETYTKKFFYQTLRANEVLRCRPKLVVTTHDPGPSAMPFVLLAQKQKIPTIVLQHGFHDLNFSADHQSDYCAVWGELFYKGYRGLLHKKPNTIFPVGFPFLDNLLRNTVPVTSSRFHLHQPLKLSLLISIYQVDQFVISKYFIELFRTLATLQFPLEIWVRTHVGQSVEGLKELAKMYHIKCIYNPRMTLEQFLSVSDIVYTWDTTAILWAMIYSKPLFYSTPWWGEGYMPVKEYQAGWVPENADAVVKRLEILHKHPESRHELYSGQQKFLKYVLGVTDGSSSKKLYSLLKKLVKKTNKQESSRNY